MHIFKKTLPIFFLVMIVGWGLNSYGMQKENNRVNDFFLHRGVGDGSLKKSKKFFGLGKYDTPNRHSTSMREYIFLALYDPYVRYIILSIVIPVIYKSVNDLLTSKKEKELRKRERLAALAHTEQTNTLMMQNPTMYLQNEIIKQKLQKSIQQIQLNAQELDIQNTKKACWSKKAQLQQDPTYCKQVKLNQAELHKEILKAQLLNNRNIQRQEIEEVRQRIEQAETEEEKKEWKKQLITLIKEHGKATEA